MSTGYPISLEILRAWSILYAIPFLGCFKFSLERIFLKSSLSSARSIVFVDVPKIFVSFSISFAIFNGVWPPNWIILPNKFPFFFSISIISLTFSEVRGSKYKRSDVSYSV